MEGMGLMMICCGMAVLRIGMLTVSVRKMKALTVEMGIVAMIDKGKWNLTCHLY